MYKLEKGIANGIKISERVLSSSHPVIKERIKKISDIKYDLYTHEVNAFNLEKPIFTIILSIYDTTIRYIEESLTSAFGQDYSNTEVVIINNGASGKVGELIWNTFIENKNARLIRTYENLYDPDADELDAPYPNLLNAAFFCSIGDYVYPLSYDDCLSLDYARRMVNLFALNDNCCTAAPLFISINENSKINFSDTQIAQATKSRNKYTDGVFLSRSYMRGERLITFAGELLSIKSNIVLKCGGFDNMGDLSQMFKFAIHGDSGFDPEARLYWRHHAQQTNKLQMQLGTIYYKHFKNLTDVYKLKEFHEAVAGSEFANEFSEYFSRLAAQSTIISFRQSYIYGIKVGLRAFINIVAQCPPVLIIKTLPYIVLDFPVMMWRNYTPLWLKELYHSLKLRFT